MGCLLEEASRLPCGNVSLESCANLLPPERLRITQVLSPWICKPWLKRRFIFCGFESATEYSRGGLFCVLRRQLPCCISRLQFIIHWILWCLVLNPAIEMSRNALQRVPSSDFSSHLLMLSIRSKSQLPWRVLSLSCQMRLCVFVTDTKLP